ncbi:MAG: hypothetical protein ABR962_09150 [Candidatus Bathyarchaeia archaeon]
MSQRIQAMLFTKITIALEDGSRLDLFTWRSNGIINALVCCARGSGMCAVIVDGKVISREGH